MYVQSICDCRWRVHPSPPSTSAYRTEIEANTGIGIEMGIDWKPFISRVLRNSMFKVRAQVCLYFIGLIYMKMPMDGQTTLAMQNFQWPCSSLCVV